MRCFENNALDIVNLMPEQIQGIRDEKKKADKRNKG